MILLYVAVYDEEDSELYESVRRTSLAQEDITMPVMSEN